MDNQQQSLSYDRLVNRAKYYKEKSLKLEKDFIFAKEKVAWLENRIENLSKEYASREEASYVLEQKIDKLNEAYKSLEEAYQKEKKHNQLNQERHQSQMTTLLNQQENQSNEAEKMEHYEQLLSQVQKDMNEKEEQIEVYRKRLNALEKRLKSSGNYSMKTRPETSNMTQTDQDVHIIAYFDYALVMDKDKCIIRGDFIIENVGNKSMDTPYICFRFYPMDAANMKGRTISTDESQVTEDSPYQWVFLDNEWAKEARERGEIWVHPISHFDLKPGEKVTISDFQVLVKTKLCDQVMVESFIFSQSDDYRSKGINQIIANF